MDVGLLDAYVLEAVPLEEDLTRLDVHLLGDTAPHRAVFRAAYRGQIRPRWGVGSQKSGVLGGDQELVQVPLVTVASTNPGDLAVRVVEEDVLAFAMSGYDAALPPGEHGSAPVFLHLEVPGSR